MNEQILVCVPNVHEIIHRYERCTRVRNDISLPHTQWHQQTTRANDETFQKWIRTCLENENTSADVQEVGRQPKAGSKEFETRSVLTRVASRSQVIYFPQGERG